MSQSATHDAIEAVGNARSAVLKAYIYKAIEMEKARLECIIKRFRLQLWKV